MVPRLKLFLNLCSRLASLIALFLALDLFLGHNMRLHLVLPFLLSALHDSRLIIFTILVLLTDKALLFHLGRVPLYNFLQGLVLNSIEGTTQWRLVDPQREGHRCSLAKLIPTIVLDEYIKRVLNIEEIAAVRSTKSVLELIALLVVAVVVGRQLNVENLVDLRLGWDTGLFND